MTTREGPLSGSGDLDGSSISGRSLSPVAHTWLALICHCTNKDGWHGCHARAERAEAFGQPTARERELLAVLL